MKVAVLAIALAAAPLLGDEVRLRGGGRLTGEIVEQTEESVTIDVGAGKMTVPMTTVVGVDKGTSPLQQYRERASKVADNDVEGWRELGKWATARGLSAQAREAYTRVHKAVPNDAEANRALGLVLYEGKWVSEEESYRARGFVEFEGEWMTPGERGVIVEQRRTREESERQALASDIKASEAAIKQREADEARRAEEASRHRDLPRLGDVQDFGWGYGPAVWPVQPGGSSK